MVIRVLHTIHSLSGGGAERQLRILVDHSREAGMQAAILCVREKGNDIRDQSVRVYTTRKSNKYNFSIFGSLSRAISDFKPDIVHTWLPASVAIPSMMMAFWKGIPCVFSYRNAMFWRHPLQILEYFAALALAERIVSNNHISRSSKHYRWLYALKRGEQIRNAVLVDKQYHKTSQFQGGNKPVKLLFVGRITGQKNWTTLISALPLIKSQYGWELTICGDGEEREQLVEAAKRAGIFDHIKLLGFRPDVYEIMRTSDVLVMPSFYEGMPNVLLEALAIGLPCIVSDLPENRATMGGKQCAVFANPNSYQEFADSINNFIADPQSSGGMVLMGRDVAVTFGPHVMVNQYLAFYKSILQSRHGTA